MKQRTLHVLLATTLLLLTALAAVPRPAYGQKDPTTFRGVVHYVESGPGANVDGIATAFLVGGVGGGVAVARMQSSLGPLLSGVLGDNPTTGQVSAFVSKSVPVDLAGMLPLSARYDARLTFTLEQQPDDTFTLREGSVQWVTSNRAEISGDGTYLSDDYGGSGQEALDPATDSIVLSFDFGGEQPTYSLEIDVSHRQVTSGNSIWSAANGAIVMRSRSQGGIETLSGNVMGEEIPEEVTRTEPHVRGIYYHHQGPLSELQFMETYRNLLDAQVLVEYEIFDSCTARLVWPTENERITLEECYSCNLEADLMAAVVPSAWAESLEWSLPQFGGKAANYRPDDRRGAEMYVWYDPPAPQRNSDFGPLEISASFVGSTESCQDPPPRKVRIFFPRDGTNNPDGSMPNWYYYWTDTRAAQGHAGAIIYDGACHDYGYYDGLGDLAKANQIYVCDIFASGNPSTNPLTGKVTEGIDLFAATVLHEWTHLENRKDWWGAASYDPSLDADRDLVKDDREAAYRLNPRVQDTFGLGFRDCEVTAYLQEDTWPTGSANSEDWSDPGKQSGS